jgi:hypothetical protein
MNHSERLNHQGNDEVCSTSNAIETDFSMGSNSMESSLVRNFVDNNHTIVATSSARSDNSLLFLPDFTEHPKPVVKRHKNKPVTVESDIEEPIPPSEDEITFFHDFVAGGVAGCASVVVGHPFDT